MRISKIVVLGDTQSGKTQLLNVITGKDPFSETYKPTIGADYYPLEGSEYTLQCWDTSGNEAHKSFSKPISNNADILVYCIDLSSEIDINKIDEEIEEFKGYSPNAAVIIVGTKFDCCTSDKGSKISELEIAKRSVFITSAKSKEGIAALKNHLFDLAHLQFPLQPLPAYTEAKQKLCNKLDSLNNRALSSEIYTALRNLESSLTHPDTKTEDKAEATQAFTKKCELILKDDHPTILQLVLAVAAVAALTVVAGLVGFGIGFALGCWTGPGAFISGLVAGQAAAVAVVSATGVTFAASSAATAYGLFRKSPVLANVAELAEIAPTGFAPKQPAAAVNP